VSAAAVIVAATISAGFGVSGVLREIEPMLRQKVVETLSAQFHSPVELDRLEMSMRKGVLVTGGGLRILYLAGPTKPDARPNAPPMLTVESFEFQTGWRELLKPKTRVDSVKVRGLRLNVPPKQERGAAMPADPKRSGQPRLGIVVDTIECTDAKVVIETTAPGKKPLEFAISRLVLTDVGAMQPFSYDAVLVNPKPVGMCGRWDTLGRGRMTIRGIHRSMEAMSLRMRTCPRFMGLAGFYRRRGGLGGRWGRSRWRE
jgi:hypothetical protein